MGETEALFGNAYVRTNKNDLRNHAQQRVLILLVKDGVTKYVSVVSFSLGQSTHCLLAGAHC